MITLAQVVSRRINPRMFYWLASTREMLHIIKVLYVMGLCLNPRLPSLQCQPRPKVDSCGSALSWESNNSSLMDLASVGRWLTTSDTLMDHCRMSTLWRICKWWHLKILHGFQRGALGMHASSGDLPGTNWSLAVCWNTSEQWAEKRFGYQASFN